MDESLDAPRPGTGTPDCGNAGGANCFAIQMDRLVEFVSGDGAERVHDIRRVERIAPAAGSRDFWRPPSA